MLEKKTMIIIACMEYGVRNERDDKNFDFAVSYDLKIANSCFRKRDYF